MSHDLCVYIPTHHLLGYRRSSSTMKVVVFLACLLVTVLAEAPLDGQYGAPRAAGPSPQYGAPRTTGPSPQYGAPSQGYGSTDYNFETANYEFQYDIEADEYGVRFGHQETRQGEVAQGKYYVLLPDGRTQVVEYVADQEGYRPKILYQAGEGGYGRGPSQGGGY